MSIRPDDSVPKDHKPNGAILPGGGPDPRWIDNFMDKILSREYDAAREVLRSAVMRGVGDRVAEQYGKVLEEFLRQRDEVENPTLLASFGACALKDSEDARGRGLKAAKYVAWGEELWRQRPLAYIQSPASRKCAQVCHACLLPIGTLASQLEHLDLPVPAEAAELNMFEGASRPFACPSGCGEFFCGEACHRWATEFLPHAILCHGRLQPAQIEALQALEQLATEADQEHLLLLAHHVAAMLLQRRAGVDLPEVLRRYVQQFASAPWDSLASETDEDDDPARRRELLGQAATHLHELFKGDELAAPFLERDLLSSMLGTYELVNMCISIPHPLNVQSKRILELLPRETLASINAAQRKVNDESDDEEEDAADVGADDEEPGSAMATAEAQAEAIEAAHRGDLFANVVGTSLIEALSFMNHSCLPNARIEFSTSASPDVTGPGLWAYSASRRPLIPGDEVLMSYVPGVIGKPLQVRQRKMKKFGFECRCRCCITDEMLEKEEEAERMSMSIGIR